MLKKVILRQFCHDYFSFDIPLKLPPPFTSTGSAQAQEDQTQSHFFIVYFGC